LPRFPVTASTGPRRKRAAVAIDDPVKLGKQGSGFFISQLKVHDLHTER
jgi:hypothetical protein